MKPQIDTQVRDAAAGDLRPLDIPTMKETARLVLMPAERPDVADVGEATAMMRGHIELLVPAIRSLIRARPSGDTAAAVASIGADEAWRRLHTTPGFGPDAARRHARKMALSVCSLCDHYTHLQPPAA